MVDQIAGRIAWKLPRLSRDELCSAGYEALTQCGQRYDPGLGCTFRTYAHHRVRGAMLDEARRRTPGYRAYKRALQELEATQMLLEEASRKVEHEGPDPRTLEQRVAAAAQLVDAAATAVMLASAKGPDPATLTDSGPAEQAEQSLDDQKIHAWVQHLLRHHCSDEERALLEALYVEGTSMADYAQQQGVNRSTISRRHAKLLRRLSAADPPDTS